MQQFTDGSFITDGGQQFLVRIVDTDDPKAEGNRVLPWPEAINGAISPNSPVEDLVDYLTESWLDLGLGLEEVHQSEALTYELEAQLLGVTADQWDQDKRQAYRDAMSVYVTQKGGENCEECPINRLCPVINLPPFMN